MISSGSTDVVDIGSEKERVKVSSFGLNSTKSMTVGEIESANSVRTWIAFTPEVCGTTNSPPVSLII